MTARPAFENYTELVNEIQNWLDRSDLSGSVPSMIGLAEARMRREFQPLLAETKTTATASGGIVTLPGDCDMVRFVEYNGGALHQVSQEHGRQFYDGKEPRGYTLESGALYLWPASDVSVTITYQPKLVSISSSNATNWLLIQHPDAYFFGAMVYAEGYLANDARAANFKALWDEAIEEIKLFLGRQRRVKVKMPSPPVIA